MTVIVGFEGISCVGKTTVIERVSQGQNIPYIAEVNEVPAGISGSFGIQEWFFKNTLFNVRNNTKNRSEKDLLIFDRTFFSSLAYTMALDKINRTKFFHPLLIKYQEEVDNSENYPDLSIVLTENQETVIERIKKKFGYHPEWSNPLFVDCFGRSLSRIIHESGKPYKTIRTRDFKTEEIMGSLQKGHLRKGFSAFLAEYYRNLPNPHKSE